MLCISLVYLRKLFGFGKLNVESRSRADLALKGNSSVMLIDDRFYNAHAEAGPTAEAVRTFACFCKSIIKYGSHFFRDAVSTIPDPETAASI